MFCARAPDPEKAFRHCHLRHPRDIGPGFRDRVEFALKSREVVVVTVAEIGRLLRTCLDERHHQVDRSIQIAGRAPVLRNGSIRVPERDSSATQRIREHSIGDQALILGQYSRRTHEARFEKTTTRGRPPERGLSARQDRRRPTGDGDLARRREGALVASFSTESAARRGSRRGSGRGRPACRS